MSNIVWRFEGEYAFLSNFYPSTLTLNDNVYRTVEHAFQASKTTSLSHREAIKEASTPGQAKRLGQVVPLRRDWEHVKLAVMHEALLAKFQQNDDLGAMLLDTGTLWLVEGNTWGDSYWGHDFRTKSGDNWLGRILMMVRSQLALG